MKEFFKMFFASLLAMVVMGFISIGLLIAGLVGLSSSLTEKDSKKNTGDVLVIDLGKRLHEQGEINSLAVFGDGSDYEPGLYDVIKAIKYAKTDNEIKGIYIKLGRTPNGWATLQQLRMALEDFKTSKKFIYAYGEDIPQAAYFVASAADSIFVNPAGDVDLKGFASVLTFFKGTLDKLEVEPEIYYAGKFKSATEPFRTDKMSEPNRQQIKAFQKGLWDQFLAGASQYMHMDKEAIHQMAVNGTIQFPADAAKNKMVASLLYWDEVDQRLHLKTGIPEKTNIRYVSMTDYASVHKNDTKLIDDKVAILFAEGNIVDGEEENEHEIASKDFCEQIRNIRKDDKIKAVVLRVNSPGGSALASEVILRELVLLKKKKPLIVAMGDYAASGGYYIACMADSIFAMPNTLTGSIGVFGMMFNVEKMMKNKLGVTFDEEKNAPYADIPTATRAMTPDEGKRVQNMIDTIYMHFKQHVADGRRMSIAHVDSFAQGRVWTGSDALGIKLVDGLGGLDRAVSSAVAMAKLKDYKVVTYPQPSDKLSKILRRFGNKTDAKAAFKAAIREEMGDTYDWYHQVRDLRKMNGKAMMIMPFVPIVE